MVVVVFAELAFKGIPVISINLSASYFHHLDYGRKTLKLGVQST